LRKEFEREIIEINCRLNLKKKFQRENQKIYQLKEKNLSTLFQEKSIKGEILNSHLHFSVQN